VPIFADPIEWDKSKAYESLTIVVHDGESYTSRCNVGPGIDITNTTYWAKTGAYNAILEQYRNEVGDLSSQVTSFATDNAEFRKKIDGYDKDNAAMKETVSSYTEKVDKLTERVTADEADIDAVQATTAQHTKDIADLKAKDADLQQQISANDTDIANINDHQTEQDSRLDSIETVNAKQETAITKNASDIAAEVSRASAAENANGKLIARNAEELAKHATQLTNHERRITALETDNVTNKADIRNNAAKNTAQDAEIEQVRDLANHKVDQTVFDAADKLNVKYSSNERRLITAPALFESAIRTRTDLNTTVVMGTNTENTGTGLYGKVPLASLALKSEVDTAQSTADTADGKADANTAVIGNWNTDHPSQTISQCVTSQETELEQHAGDIARLEADKANKTDLNQYVTNTTYTAGQKTQDDRITALENKPASDFRMTWGQFTAKPVTGPVAAFNGVGYMVSGTPQALDVVLAGSLPVEDNPIIDGNFIPYRFDAPDFEFLSLYLLFFTSSENFLTEIHLGPGAGPASGGVSVANGLYKMTITGTSVDAAVTDIKQIRGYSWYIGPSTAGDAG
jgi:predicted  nucleic acid-binding Zn-ribbon protein